MCAMQSFSNKQANASSSSRSFSLEIWYMKNGRIVINCLSATLQWINDITINFIAFESVRTMTNGVSAPFEPYFQLESNVYFTIAKAYAWISFEFIDHGAWSCVLRNSTTIIFKLNIYGIRFMIWFSFYQCVHCISKYICRSVEFGRPFKWHYCKLIKFTLRREWMLRITW